MGASQPQGSLPQLQKSTSDISHKARGAGTTINAPENKNGPCRSKRQRKVLNPKRESRRLAGHTPEYGMNKVKPAELRTHVTMPFEEKHVKAFSTLQLLIVRRMSNP